MGVGTPEDLLNGIKHGIDMFDCVLPTRNARHGSFFTWDVKQISKIKNTKMIMLRLSRVAIAMRAEIIQELT